MNISDEMLMAYADNEVDETTREYIERALLATPALRTTIDRHRMLRTQLNAAFDSVLAEPVPTQLQSLLAAPTPTAITDFAQAQAQRQSQRSRFQQPSTWLSLAASVVLGVAMGYITFGTRDAMIVTDSSGLVAAAALERALSYGSASDAESTMNVQIGISYLAKSGEYCRSFFVSETSLAGFACRDANAWRIRMLAPAQSQAGEIRTASSTIPESLLTFISQDMQGNALDAEEEASAAKKGWRKADSQ